MMRIKMPYRYFRRLVKYLVIIVFVVLIYFTLYIILKPFRHKIKLRSNSIVNSNTGTPNQNISKLITTSTAKPEVDTCQIEENDDILEASNVTGLVNQMCPRTSTFQLLFESRSTPYHKLVPLKNNMTEALTKYNLKSCCFRGVIPRKSKTCSTIRLKKETKIPSDLEVISIECQFDPLGSDSMIFKNLVDVHVFTPIKHGAQKRVKIHRKENEKIDKQVEKMNVIILGMNGVSRIDFKRKFKKTKKYLHSKLNALEMEKFTQIGDDILSNLGPLLTNSSTNGTFIFQNYADSGYYTLFAEDQIVNSTIPKSLAHQLKLNVTSDEIDYHFPQVLSTTLVDEHDDNHNVNITKKLICYGPRPTFQVLLDYMQKMILRMTTRRNDNFFQFAWLSSPSFIEDDTYLESFLSWCYQSGILNNTLLILLSDQSLSTTNGELINNLPLMQILMPTAFQKKYPTAYWNLMKNRKRIITVRDVYQTLRHILLPPEALEYLISPQSSSSSPEGTSLFLPISKNRTCKTANIPVKHCPCNRHLENLSLNHSSVEPATTFAVNSINSMLTMKGNGSCAYLYLSQILEAKLFYFLDGGDENEYFQITFQTNPGNGTFTALVTQSWGNEQMEFALSGNILRKNYSYGNQTSCLQSSENNNILMYCYCVQQLNDKNTIKSL